mmetsp:Transcript_75977/g.158442  ORF Transcript_75977/g.158442 Transcript_75977/m.158442 type:complete len:209 (-) Transcript_75977:553-1179(-)
MMTRPLPAGLRCWPPGWGPSQHAELTMPPSAVSSSSLKKSATSASSSSRTESLQIIIGASCGIAFTSSFNITFACNSLVSGSSSSVSSPCSFLAQAPAAFIKTSHLIWISSPFCDSTETPLTSPPLRSKPTIDPRTTFALDPSWPAFALSNIHNPRPWPSIQPQRLACSRTSAESETQGKIRWIFFRPTTRSNPIGLSDRKPVDALGR